MPKKLKK